VLAAALTPSVRSASLPPLVSLLLAVSEGTDWGWTSAPTLGLGAAAFVLFMTWGRYELRTREPLVDLRTLVRGQVLLTNIASAIFGFAMFSMSLVLPQLLQLPRQTGYGLGQSMLVVGLVMAPSGFVMMAVAPVSAKISATWGPKWSLMFGALVVARDIASRYFRWGQSGSWWSLQASSAPESVSPTAPCPRS
jgi:hypothetical protein